MNYTNYLSNRNAPKILANYDLGDFTITIVEEYLPEDSNTEEAIHSFYLSCCGYAKRMFSILESAASEEMYKKLIENNIENEINAFKAETADFKFEYYVLNP